MHSYLENTFARIESHSLLGVGRKEEKPPLESHHCAVYCFKYDVCDDVHVGYTCRHLHRK